MFRSTVTAILAIASLCAAPLASAQIFTVGPGGQSAGCSTDSIQSAINAASNNYTIRIVGPQTYTAQALVLTNKTLTLSGGWASCGATTPTGLTTLSGLGGSNDSVVTIRGNSNVTLENLSIIRGDEVSDGYGGGIDYRGRGSLVLRNTALAQNFAGYGGGMNVESEGGQVTVELRSGTVVQLNTAQYSGGGIRLDGDVRLRMIETDTIILANEARGIDPSNNQPRYGNGGGLQVIAPARADIGSPGFGVTGPIANNTARYGGGVAVDGTEDSPGDALVRVFTTDPARPTRIQGNRATQTGGAFHLLPVESGVPDFTFSGAQLCLWDVRIENNKAQNGAAIYADTDFVTLGPDFASSVYVNRENGAGGSCADRPTGLGAVPCAQQPCTVVSGNRSVDALDQATGGATVLFQNETDFLLRNIAFQRNEAGDLLRLFEPDAAYFDQLLVTENTLSGSVLRIEGGSLQYRVSDTTIANNTMGSAPVLSIAANFTLQRSIVWQPGRTVLSRSGTLVVDDVIANETGSLLGGPEAIVAPPRFTDPAHGDYLPIAASAAVDFAAAAGAPERDLAGAPRAVDLPVHANARGVLDAGGLERQEVGNLVLNPEFPPDYAPDQLRLWTSAPGLGSAAWNDTQGVGATPGSVYVTYQPPIGSPESPAGGPPAYTGLRQCVLLPGPGVYALSGWSLVPGSGVNRDYARLHWVLRNASADCTGAIAAEGDHFLPRSGSWQRSVPVEIPIAPGAWTIDSSIEITMEILDGDTIGTNLIDAYFDRIELRVVALEVDALFRDGFESP